MSSFDNDNSENADRDKREAAAQSGPNPKDGASFVSKSEMADKQAQSDDDDFIPKFSPVQRKYGSEVQNEWTEGAGAASKFELPKPESTPRLSEDMQEFGFHKDIVEKPELFRAAKRATPYVPPAMDRYQSHLNQVQSPQIPVSESDARVENRGLELRNDIIPLEQTTPQNVVVPFWSQHSAPEKENLTPSSKVAASASGMSAQQDHLQVTQPDNKVVSTIGDGLNSEVSPLGAVPTSTVAPVGELSDAQKQAAVIRDSLYWVIEEKEMVTHAEHAEFEPPDDADLNGSAIAFEAYDPDALNSAASDQSHSNQSAADQSASDHATEDHSPLDHAASDRAALDYAPTVRVIDATADSANEPDKISGASGLIEPSAQANLQGVGPQNSDVRERPEASRPRLQSNLLAPKSPPSDSDDPRRVTHDGKKKVDEDEVKKQKLKKTLLSVGSIVLLCVASVVLTYDTIVSKQPVETSTETETPKTAEPVKNESPTVDPAKSEPAKDAKVQSVKEELELAFALEQKKNYMGALEHFDAVLDVDANKKDAKALHGRGRVLTKLQRYERALIDLESASDLDKKNELILIDLAAVKYLLADYSGAAREYERILSAHEGDVDALYGRGISYAAMGKHEQAIADFENVVKLKPGYDKAYRQMCTTYLSMSQPDKAEAAITVAMKSCGLDADLFFSRGLARYQMGRKDEAVEDYDEAIKIEPQRKEYFNDRGYVLMELGRSDDAKKDFRKALEIDPHYKLAVDNLARIDKLRKRRSK
ncbi:MAG: tetratricopeptide repeat protein [Candidatus Melainabacteria bacterium]|nr:tetratricopeptide repeat protein [Candidatus Melainabacteria bacterium]